MHLFLLICSSLCCHRARAKSTMSFCGRVVSVHLATFLFAQLFFSFLTDLFPSQMIFNFFLNQKLESKTCHPLDINLDTDTHHKETNYFCWLPNSYLGNTWSCFVNSVCWFGSLSSVASFTTPASSSVSIWSLSVWISGQKHWKFLFDLGIIRISHVLIEEVS